MSTKNASERPATQGAPWPEPSTGPTKLLEDCPRCGRPIFWGRMDARRVAVEALETRRGDIALQAQIGSDELVATKVGSGTFYRLHHFGGGCIARGFSRPPGARKVR